MSHLSRLLKACGRPPVRPKKALVVARQDYRPALINKDDAPITKCSDDELGRKDFAAGLATSFSSYFGKTSFVVSINGKWGCGKTSLMNMCRENLEKKIPQPTVIEIDGWDWTDSSSIGNVLLAKLDMQLGRASSDEVRRIGKLFHLYSLDEEEKSFLSSATYDLMFFFYGLALVAMNSFKIVPEPWMLTAFGWVMLLFSGYNLLAKYLSQHHGIISKIFHGLADFLDVPTSVRKQEIVQAMENLDAHIYVVIDDIDRLDAEEIRQLLRVVKTNLNFPNLIFILLCDEDQLVNAVSSTSGSNESTASDGRRFLEKIIQLSIRVPAIEEGTLPQLFTARLNRLLEYYKHSEDFDWKRWKEIRDKVVYPFFKNMRDLVRFFNSFDFVLSRLIQKDDYTVDCLDVLCMELLNTFEPAVWDKISSSRLYFTYQYTKGKYEFVTEDEMKGALDALKPLCHSNEAATFQLIREVFPNLAAYFGTARPEEGSRENWFHLKRICHPRIFERYFLRRANAGDVLHADIYALYTVASHRYLLLSELRNYIKQDRFSTLLNRIHVFDILPFETDTDEDEAFSFITALMDCFDEYYDGEPSDPGGRELRAIDYQLDFAFPEILAYRAVCKALKPFHPVRLYKILGQSFSQTWGILLPCEILSRFIVDLKEKPNTAPVNDTTIKMLTEIVRSKLARYSDNGTLLQHPRCSDLLLYWHEFDAEQSKAWLLASLRNENRQGVLDAFCSLTVLEKTGLRKVDTRKLGIILSDVELKEIGLEHNSASEDELAGFQEIKDLNI